MAKLVVITKGTPGMAHELNGHWTTVGRADGNLFQIVEPSVSGRHCEVRVQGEELIVRDLLSTNGTFVRGQKITEGVLKPGHTLRLGDVELRFENSAAAPAPIAPQPGTSFISKMLLKKSAPAVTPPKTEAIPVQPAPVAKPEVADNTPKKFHALFVDDSMAFLETFTELCSTLANNTWKIHRAATADRALAILQENKLDLVVLDIGIPMVDGIQLLNIIKRRYPAMKIAVMTGNATESNRAACLSGDADLFIEKPVSPDGIKVAFNMLNDLMSWTAREGFSGSLREVNMQDLIQMECIGRRSTIFEIRNREMTGEIYIEDGAIIHAAVDELAGEAAFNRLMSIKGGEFQMKPFEPPKQRTIKSGWEVLLMEAARASDEETAFVTKPAAPAPVPQTVVTPEPAPRPAAQVEHGVAGDDFVVVASYDGQWSSEDAVKK